ncbi:MAG: glucose-6-phosphate dehydrogenase [Actinobacteria bacterium]|nr:glucose-6-phosphate dehydrogenase [Actinomycetota bacterium]
MTHAVPTSFVVFGVTGDLAHRKLIPALFDAVADTNDHDVRLIGVSSQPVGAAGVQEIVRKSLADRGNRGSTVARFVERSTHALVSRDSDTLDDLGRQLREIEGPGPNNRVFYLAIPPGPAASISTMIGKARLLDAGGWGRIVLEKPFGRDLASATALNELLHEYFSETQIYRMDHYLGKEAVQNLLTFRFANPLFESTWNRDRIESVDIRVAEDIGVGERAGYYEKSGAVRDMIQNHLTQLTTLVGMEAPSSFTAEAIRDSKVRVLESVRTVATRDVVYGQYASASINGELVPGYLDEPDVDPGSKTPTFVHIRLAIDNWRWQGVPFYLTTGKRLHERSSAIVVTYRPAPVCIFHGREDDCPIGRNTVTLRIQPHEGFDVGFSVKDPDPEMQVVSKPLSFDYSDAFKDIPDAYRTLVTDILEGDQTLFVRGDEVEASWRVYEDVLEPAAAPLPYPAGSSGPKLS